MRGRTRFRGGILGVIVLATMAMVASTAQASFHFMKIREVHTGGANGGSYVELQMWTSGQNFVQDQPIVVYATGGTPTHTFRFPSNVGDAFYGAPSQSTILVAGVGYSTVFPSGPTPDAVDPELNLQAAGGAVCFSNASPPDCISWGSFAGNESLPAPGAGSPVSIGGVTGGRALHRSISPPCSSLLEPEDDTDNSAVDFFERRPDPRSYSSPIVETACITPVTTIGTKPSNPTNSTSATFTFTAPGDATFQCKLDAGAFVECDSGSITYPVPLSEGIHRFEVRATNANGTGPTASYSWRVDLTAPTAIIDTMPPSPSSGRSPTFTFHASESATFECSMVSDGASDVFDACSSPKTYPSITSNGSYVFKVRARDAAQNQGAPASHRWVVDTSLVDDTAPIATIQSKPPDPSQSSTAFFTYASNEPGSTFECALDGAGFSSCPVAGIIYSNLSNGPHSFQVRATDTSLNRSAPAGYSWAVAVPDATQLLPVLPLLSNPILDTKIVGKPVATTRDRTPTFRFQSTIAPATFECKLDGAAFKSCRSPFTTKRLAFGRHLVQVRARAGGRVDPTPARRSFKVVKPKKKKAKRKSGKGGSR